MEEDLNRGPSAYQPNASPLGQTGSHLLPPLRQSIIVPNNPRRYGGCFLYASYRLSSHIIVHMSPRTPALFLICQQVSKHFALRPKTHIIIAGGEDNMQLAYIKNTYPAARGWLVSRGTSVRIRFGSPFSSKIVVYGHCLVTLSLSLIHI